MADNITITEQEILDAQKGWGEGIVEISNARLEGRSFEAAAIGHINKFYNYAEGPVLFKPTLVSERQFRTTFEGALSYFIGGNKNFPEDHGFAIKPWSAVQWENIGIKIIGNMAVAMGNYYFTHSQEIDDKGGVKEINPPNVVKVEYSFAYTKDANGALKIVLHDSHVPYNPS